LDALYRRRKKEIEKASKSRIKERGLHVFCFLFH